MITICLCNDSFVITLYLTHSLVLFSILRPTLDSCDCKEQFENTLQYIQKHGGCIIYMQQEGRGIGLANKVAAYALQDQGIDTVDANTMLGFPKDCRQYGAVPSILQDMKIASIQLITNNPRKVNRLTSLGVNVKGTIPMVVDSPTLYNRRYLQTKQERMNHQNFGDLLRNNSEMMLSKRDFTQQNTPHQ